MQTINTTFETGLRNALAANIRDQASRHPTRNAFSQYWPKAFA